MNENRTPIVKYGVRILRPDEYKRVLEQVKKQYHKTMLQTLMYTGMRYIEAQRFHNNPNWFDGDFIKVDRSGVKKTKIKMKERWIRLNTLGKAIVPFFLQLDNNLPTNQTWRDNMRRWARNAKLDPVGMCPKTTRKTWESWLVYYFPERFLQVTQSQGHDTVTSVDHYLNMPFTEIDKIGMGEFVSGWI